MEFYVHVLVFVRRKRKMAKLNHGRESWLTEFVHFLSSYWKHHKDSKWKRLVQLREPSNAGSFLRRNLLDSNPLTERITFRFLTTSSPTRSASQGRVVDGVDDEVLKVFKSSKMMKGNLWREKSPKKTFVNWEISLRKIFKIHGLRLRDFFTTAVKNLQWIVSRSARWWCNRKPLKVAPFRSLNSRASFGSRLIERFVFTSRFDSLHRRLSIPRSWNFISEKDAMMMLCALIIEYSR